MTPSASDTPALVGQLLACPVTKAPLSVVDGRISATGSPFCGRIEHDVAVMLDAAPASFFDDKFAIMQRGHEKRGGEWRFAYQQQVELLEARLAKGGLVLDVGCGPGLPYAKPPQATVIGLDYSLPSIAANGQVDLRVCASAAALPLADASIDTIVCLYSIHHMIGSRLAEAETLVGCALAEFARVLKPQGECLIFEMSPIPPFGAIERLIWNCAKSALGSRLDMFFWPQSDFIRHAAKKGWQCPVEIQTFTSSPWTTFPPVFSLPWLKIPRFLYPMQPVVYRLRH